MPHIIEHDGLTFKLDEDTKILPSYNLRVYKGREFIMEINGGLFKNREVGHLYKSVNRSYKRYNKEQERLKREEEKRLKERELLDALSTSPTTLQKRFKQY